MAMEEERRKVIIAETAKAVAGRVDKHWKVDTTVSEIDRAKNLDFGTFLDYYETPQPAKESEPETGLEPAREEDAVAAEPPLEPSDVGEGGPESDLPAADAWQVALDEDTRCCYYYNAATGVTQWHRPEGPVNGEEGMIGMSEEGQVGREATGACLEGEAGAGSAFDPTGARSANGAEEARNRSPLWWYKDLQGCSQGPYTLAMLRSWAGYLPMDILVWCEAAGDEGMEREAAEEMQSAAALARKGAGGRGEASEPTSVELPRGQAKCITFAKAMGYGGLLSMWRDERGEDNCMGYGIAPTISAFGSQVSWPGLDSPSQGAHDGESGVEAVKAGKTLDWRPPAFPSCHPGQAVAPAFVEDYAVRGFYNRKTGRIQAGEGMASTVSDALGNVPHAYSGTGLERHMDVGTLDEQMRASDERRHRKLSRDVVEKLKARKKEVKKKMKKASMS